MGGFSGIVPEVFGEGFSQEARSAEKRTAGMNRMGNP
jgi:hypothetical protein